MFKYKNILASLSILLFTGIFLYCSNESNQIFIARVNNEPISKKLFQQLINKNRSTVYTTFTQKYGEVDSKDFWNHSFNGEIPIDVLKQTSLKECIRIKVEQILAREKGIITDISYNGFLNSLEKINREREQLVKNKKVVYGPTQYSEDAYFDNFTTTMVMKLKEKLAENTFNVSEESLLVFYEKNKDTLYKDNKTHKYFSFQEVKNLVRSNSIDNQYTKLIDGLIQNAKVEINEPELKSVSIN